MLVLLRLLIKPIHAAVAWVGAVLARMGFIDAARAERISDLAWPRIVTGLARMSKTTADVAMVGSAVGASAIAGVGYAIPFWALAFMVGGGIAGGTISLVSQRFAANQHVQGSIAVKVSAWLALGTMLPFVAIFWAFPEAMIGIIGTGDEAVALGAEYLQIACFSMPFAALNLVGSRTLVAANDAWTPMIARAGSAVINIGMNAVLIFLFDLGVTGAAIGTVVANVATTVAFAWGLLKGALPLVGPLPVRIDPSAPHWDARTARQLVKISTPLALTNLGQHGGQFPMLAVVSLFGPNVVAAFVIALRLRDLMNTPGWGFGLASSSLVGQFLGTSNEDEAGAYARDTLRFSVTIYSLVSALVFVLAHPIGRLFVDDPSILVTTVPLIRMTCLSAVFWGVMNGSLGPLRASGDTRWPLYGQILGLAGFALPAAYLGATTAIGIVGLYMALLLETGVPAAVTYFRFRTDKWKVVSRAYRPAA